LVDGRIVETGGHKQLMERNNVYAGLIRTFHNHKEGEDDMEEAGNALKEKADKEESMQERKERALSELSGRSRASSILSDIVPNVQADDGGKLVKDEVRSTEAVGLETY
ncbi:hypothetical protein, partial [Salmonella sp. s55044]